MKTQSSALYILRLTLTLFLITAVVAGLLAGVNSITKPLIAQRQADKLQSAIAAVLPGATVEETLTEVPDETGMVKTVYTTDLGYAIEVAPAGFNGAVTMMVGVDAAGAVTGLSIVSHTETPGLGASAAAQNAKGNAFREQFLGATEALAVTKDGGTVDALTGATITSRAVTSGVNAALACAAALSQQG